jgi:pimeloyl-ACP methyl ester carboxylesterase
VKQDLSNTHAAFRARSLVIAIAALALLSGCDDRTQSLWTGGAAEDGGGAGGHGGGAVPCTPAGSETVEVANEFGTLEGTLLLPESCEPVDVVLILSGSGWSDRDGGRLQVYRTLAEALLAQGIGSLRFDEPGIGASASGRPESLEDFRFEMEVANAARWVRLLREDERIDDVVIAGHSQGSLTGILAAQQEHLDGFISLAGVGRPIGDLLREQLEGSLTDDELAELDEAIAKLEGGELAGQLSAPLDDILPVEAQAYVISWMQYDPRVEIGHMTIPALLVQGEVDRQVPVDDAQLLKEGYPDAELVLIDDMCHVLKQADASTASQEEAYTDPSVPLASALVPATVAFITHLP